MNTGLHIISDLYFCKNEKSLIDHTQFFDRFLRLIHLNNMVTFGHIIKYFGEEFNSGYTLLIGLEESHISLHTFPLQGEDCKVSLDIYTCSITKDNGEACKKLYKFLIEELQPTEVKNEHLIERI